MGDTMSGPTWDLAVTTYGDVTRAAYKGHTRKANKPAAADAALAQMGYEVIGQWHRDNAGHRVADVQPIPGK